LGLSPDFLLKSGQSLAVHLNNEEAVKLGTALFQIVAEKTPQDGGGPYFKTRWIIPRGGAQK